MPESQTARQVCVLLRDGQVVTDDRGRLPACDDDGWLGSQLTLEHRATASGDPGAVLVAPQLLVHSEPPVLLNVFGSRSGRDIAGSWTNLDGLAHEDAALVDALREAAAVVAGRAEAPDGRPDWFRAGWYDEVDSWVDDRLAGLGRVRTGPLEPAKVWSLSAVLKVPCDPAPVWFKASCPHFHAEPALTLLVAAMLPEHAPPILGADEQRSWLLMEELLGASEDHEDDPPAGIGLAAARTAAILQLRSRDHLAEIEAAGVPVRPLTSTLHQFDEILSDGVELDQLTHEELAAARSVRDDVHAVVEELDSLGIPDTLVHGDLHTGNVAHDGDSLVLYDWSDAAVSHPFLDVVLLTQRLPEDESLAARERYAETWRAAYPDLDVTRALELADPANTIYQMVTFEQIYRAQEEASLWEMRGVVSRMLRKLPQRFPRRS
jgi:aminoglycoside phosphotransferase (APT) family kinase protein